MYDNIFFCHAVEKSDRLRSISAKVFETTYRYCTGSEKNIDPALSESLLSAHRVSFSGSFRRVRKFGHVTVVKGQLL
jgi:hypothetical protein